MSIPNRLMNESKRAEKKREQNMEKQKQKHIENMKKLVDKKDK